MDVALGTRPADTVIQNARLLNVFTGEFLPDQSVAIAAGRVAAVGDDLSGAVGPNTTIVPADGQTLIPGFIDGHTHLFASRYGIEEFLRHSVPGGTTLAISEITELGSIAGLEGIEAELEALRDQPIKLLATLPPLAALAPFMEGVAPSIDKYRELLDRPEIAGLGEVYWGNLLRGDERLGALIESALEAGRVAEGHAAGARGAKLQAYACAGLSSCHEPITAEEGLERLRAGMHFMAREGEIRQDLEAIAPLWRKPIDLRRMILVTDSVGPERLAEQGYLDHCVRKAISLGLDPAQAIQMVTLNVAEHFHLDQHVGSIAPGRCADLVLLPDEWTIRPTWVMSNGQIVAREGRLIVPTRATQFSDALNASVRLPRPLCPEDFAIPRPAQSGCNARVVEMATGLVTREAEETFEPAHDPIEAEPERDLLKVAVINRTVGTGERFVGLLRGYGLRAGAVATTMAWDAQAMVVVGADDADMARAANRLVETQGGAAVVQGGRLVAELQAPIGGLLSREPLGQIVEAERAIQRSLAGLGCPWPKALLAVDVLTTAAIPHFRVTERGYVRVRDGALLPLWRS